MLLIMDLGVFSCNTLSLFLAVTGFKINRGRFTANGEKLMNRPLDYLFHKFVVYRIDCYNVVVSINANDDIKLARALVYHTDINAGICK